MKPKLIIMVGNIVTGKTTWIKKYLARQQTCSTVVLSKDAIRKMIGAGKYTYCEFYEPLIHKSMLNLLGNFMVHNTNVIIDDNNVEKIYRGNYLNFTTKKNNIGYDYETIAAIMPNITVEEAIKRRGLQEGMHLKAKNKQRWKNVWEFFESKFEEPTKQEGFDLIWRL